MLKKFIFLPKLNLLSKQFNFKFSTTEINPKPIKQFTYLVRRLNEISELSSRNACIDQLENLIQNYLQINDKQLFLSMMKLLSCRVDSEEIQIANQSLIQIMKDVFPEEDVEKYMYEKGDIGQFAKESLQKKIQKERSQLNQQSSQTDQESLQSNISIVELVEFFDKLKNLSGDGSRQEKQQLVIDYLNKIRDPLEMQFFIRIISRCLRIGISDKSIIKALMNINKKQNNSLDSILEDLQNKIFGYNIGLISDINVGTPIPPMLSKAISDFDSVIKFLKKYESKKVSLELKYDGERSQVHYSKQLGVKLFSRNLELQNEKYPQLVKDLQNYFEKKQINNCIIDGEVVVTDSNGNIKSFQEQQKNRKRIQKDDISSSVDIENNEKIFIFDVIQVNSKSLLQENQLSRKNYIQKYFPVDGPVDHAQSQILDLSIDKDLQVLKQIVKEYVDQKFEGAMVKSLDETTFYDTNGRTQWAKLKKQILTGSTADTFDVIPIAAYYGKGKRSGKYGAYLLACYDENQDQYVALCKIGTGFSDKFLQESTERLKNKISLEKPEQYLVHRSFKPDVWLQKDTEVWEIEADSFSISPIYSIGQEYYGGTGISLRFPRFIIVREDKTTKESTTVQQIVQLYDEQVEQHEKKKKIMHQETEKQE